jgi:hypothetical protein
MVSVPMNSRLRALENLLVGAYVSGIEFRFGCCLKIVISKLDNDKNPTFLSHMEVTFSSIADCRVNFSALPSLRIIKGLSCISKSSRDNRLKKVNANLVRPKLNRFKLKFSVGSCEFLAHDFSICTLSDTPIVKSDRVKQRGTRNAR